MLAARGRRLRRRGRGLRRSARRPAARPATRRSTWPRTRTWSSCAPTSSALPDGAPGRAPLRRRLADEYARRLARRALTHGDHGDALHRAARSCCALWSADELRRPAAVGRELAAYRAALARAREVFARAGRDRETAAALARAGPRRAGARRRATAPSWTRSSPSPTSWPVAEDGDGAVGAAADRDPRGLDRGPPGALGGRPAGRALRRAADRRSTPTSSRARRDLGVIRAHGDPASRAPPGT